MDSPIHVLNGDALAHQFVPAQIQGKVVVMREALVEGPLTATVDENFWQMRKAFIEGAHPDAAGYQQLVINELAAFPSADKADAIYLWFENDLFCQVNYWFLLHWHLQRGCASNLFRVYPQGSETWRTFARHRPEDLQRSFEDAVPISNRDQNLASELWTAFCLGDTTRLLQEAHASPALESIDSLLHYWHEAGGRQGVARSAQQIARSRDSFTAAWLAFRKQFEFLGYGDRQFEHAAQTPR